MLFAVRRALSAEALAEAGVVGRALSAEALAEAGVVNIRLRGYTNLHSHYLHCHCDPSTANKSPLRGYTSLHSHYLHCHCDPAKREWQSFFLVFTFVFCLLSFALFYPAP